MVILLFILVSFVHTSVRSVRSDGSTIFGPSLGTPFMNLCSFVFLPSSYGVMVKLNC